MSKSVFDYLFPKSVVRRSASETLSTNSLGVQANVNGSPTYALAESHRDNLEAMLACCRAETENYLSQRAGQRVSPAPFYFERAAILSRKAKKFEQEIEICQQWKALIDDYKSQPIVKNGLSTKTHLSTKSKALINRITKAKELLRKSRVQHKSRSGTGT